MNIRTPLRATRTVVAQHQVLMQTVIQTLARPCATRTRVVMPMLWAPVGLMIIIVISNQVWEAGAVILIELGMSKDPKLLQPTLITCQTQEVCPLELTPTVLMALFTVIVSTTLLSPHATELGVCPSLIPSSRMMEPLQVPKQRE